VNNRERESMFHFLLNECLIRFTYRVPGI